MSTIDYSMAMDVGVATDGVTAALRGLRRFEHTDLVPTPYQAEGTLRSLRILVTRAAEAARLARALERRVRRDQRDRKTATERNYRALRQLIEVEGSFVKPGEYFTVVGDSSDVLGIRVVRLNPRTVTVWVLDTARFEYVRPDHFVHAHRVSGEYIAEAYPQEASRVAATAAVV